MVAETWQTYNGRLQIGEDLMTSEIGDRVTVRQNTTVQWRVVPHLGVSVGAFVDEPAGAAGIVVNCSIR
jgi:hypothetical protein